MNRTSATQFCRSKLDSFGLDSWKIRLTTDPNVPFLGLCDHGKSTIILNAHHIDIHPESEVINTILHEIAHSLTPGHAHDEVWAAKAKSIGCDNTLPCSHLGIPDAILDAIRSGANIEMTVEEEIQVIRRPKYEIKRLQEVCPFCGKPAKEKFNKETVDRAGNKIILITLECFHIITKVVPKGTPFESMVSNFWKDEIRACAHEWNKHQCIKCHEYRLMPFQVVGSRFIESALALQKGCLVADDMGLGKTVQALSYPRFNQKGVPFLVITKSAVTYQWFAQIIRWLGKEYFSQIIRTGKDPILPYFKSYIIPYDLLRRMPVEKIDWLRDNIKLVILDECQQIKNPDSSRTQEVRKICKNPELKVIELSGTPWKNKGSEFFPALNLIDPMKFWSYDRYIRDWVDFYWEGNKKKMGGIKNVGKFKEHTNNLIIRREFNEVIEDFPQINRMRVPVKLDEFTQTTYDDAVSEFVDWYNDYVLEGTEDQINGIELLGKMARMRHICGLAKIPATLGFIEEFVNDTDKKLVVFVHHLDVAKLINAALVDTNKTSNEDWHDLAQVMKDESMPVFMYHSGLNGIERADLQNKFNSTKRCIMIASTLACGEGVDLQSCSDSILHERQWNPQNEEQATPGRFRRIGQEAKVINITVPHAEDTMDDHIDMIIERKRGYFHPVMNKSEMKSVWGDAEMGKALASLIVAKHNEKFKGKKKMTGKTRMNFIEQAI